MTAQPFPFATATEDTLEARIPAPRLASETRLGPLLRVEWHYHEPSTAELCVHGEVDVTNSDRLGELICSRLRSPLRVLVLDVSGLGFLSVSGAGMLAYAAQFAVQLGTELHIVPGDSHAVRCVLRVTGFDQHLPL